jgi:hypothetical protein
MLQSKLSRKAVKLFLRFHAEANRFESGAIETVTRCRAIMFEYHNALRVLPAAERLAVLDFARGWQS